MREESPWLGLRSQDSQKSCCNAFLLPYQAEKPSHTHWQPDSSGPPWHTRVLLRYSGKYSPLQFMFSCARHCPKCCPATASKSGSAAGHPSDSDPSVGIGWEAEPGWVIWYQPTPGKVSEINRSREKMANSVVLPDTASSLGWGRTTTAISKKNIYYHCDTTSGRLSVWSDRLFSLFSTERKMTFHSLMSLLVVF